MKNIERKQFVQVISDYTDSCMVSYYDIDSIMVVNYGNNIYMLVENGDRDFIDILRGEIFVGEYKKLKLISFRDYVSDNFYLFNSELVNACLDKNDFNDVSFKTDEFIKYYDNIKNRVVESSEKDYEILEDGTIIETITTLCDRTSILDKLISFDAVSEESLIALICDMDLEFKSIRTLVKSEDGKVLIDSFVIMAGDRVILDEKIQLSYKFNNGLFNSKKNITSQTLKNKYEEYKDDENYSSVLKLSVEEENKNNKVYLR